MPITIPLLALVAASGLVALFLAARAAFATVAGPQQAVAAALLIEAGAIVEAVTFARSRNWLAGVGLAIMFAVSATYNYTQAHDARPELLWWQLAALALGPLSALTFISLALGTELRKHNQRTEAERAEEVAYQRHEEALARRRAERREYKAVTVTGQMTDSVTDVPRWQDKQAFLDDTDRPDDLTIERLAKMSGRSERTARRWLRAATENGNRRIVIE